MRLHDAKEVFDRVRIVLVRNGVEEGVVALDVPSHFRITVTARIVHDKEFIPMMCKVLTQKVEKTLCCDAAAVKDLVGDASVCRNRKYACILLEDLLGMRLDRAPLSKRRAAVFPNHEGLQRCLIYANDIVKCDSLYRSIKAIEF